MRTVNLYYVSNLYSQNHRPCKKCPICVILKKHRNDDDIPPEESLEEIMEEIELEN